MFKQSETENCLLIRCKITKKGSLQKSHYTLFSQITVKLNVHFYYRSQMKLRESNVFTPVCHSAHGGGGVYLWVWCLLWVGAGGVSLWVRGGGVRLWVRGVHPPGHTHAPQHTFPRTHTTPVEMAIEAGGTHPTGMHSGWKMYSNTCT